MNPRDIKNIQLALKIAELALKYGIPAIINVVEAWKKEQPTIDDIVDLKSKLKGPEGYFE